MSKKPNLLFIMCDQLRWDGLGFTGGWAKTPHIDALANGGLAFERCYTTSPVCVPTRRSLASGHYPHTTGIWNNCDTTMPADQPTWTACLRDGGYRTSLFGKTHLHPHDRDLRDSEALMHGWGLDDVDEIGGPRASCRVGSYMTDSWENKGLWQNYKDDYKERFSNKPWVVRPSVLPLEDYADTYVGQQAKHYLHDYNRDNPWFCWVSFGGPHEPWDTPEEYAQRYANVKMPSPHPAPTNESDERPTGDLDKRLSKAPNLNEDEILAMRRDYAGNMTLIDDQIGEIIATIKARREWDNTIVIFTSDHGEHNGDYGLIYKSTFTDSAARVPLIISTPRSRATGGTTSTSPVEWIDIGPTFCDLAGIELNHKQCGRSLAQCLRDSQHAPRDFAVSELSGEIMLATNDKKAVFNRGGDIYIVHDLIADPHELRNLAGSHDGAEIEAWANAQIGPFLIQNQVRLPA